MTLSESDFNGTHYVTEFQRTFEVGTPPEGNGGLQVTPQGPSERFTSGDDGGSVSFGDAVTTGQDPDSVSSSVWVEIVRAGAGSIDRSESAAYEITCASSGGSLTVESVDGTPVEPFFIDPEYRYTPIRR